jgi:riboflavin kinase / FMN adenylyltransferase
MPHFLAIGSFDGVHLGHRRLLRAAVRGALKLGLPCRVLYFPRPPKFFFSGENENCLITLPAEREALLRSLGPDQVAPLEFGGAFSRLSAGEFFEGLVRKGLMAGGLCVGPDFAVGRGREGHSAFLRRACRGAGIAFRTVPFALLGGHRVSSSRVRALLRAGAVEEANACLGWNYSASGPVVRGAGLGRKLGFPTANIAVDSAKILPPGIFAARVRVSGGIHDAVLNVGRRPTVGTLGGRLILEAHLLDFSRDIYGEEMAVTFLRHLRPERRFGSKEALIAHITADIAAARACLAKKRNFR